MVTPPAITKTVTALETVGLVSRQRPADDRRVVRVAATPAGRRLLERGRRLGYGRSRSFSTAPRRTSWPCGAPPS